MSIENDRNCIWVTSMKGKSPQCFVCFTYCADSGVGRDAISWKGCNYRCAIDTFRYVKLLTGIWMLVLWCCFSSRVEAAAVCGCRSTRIATSIWGRSSDNFWKPFLIFFDVLVACSSMIFFDHLVHIVIIIWVDLVAAVLNHRPAVGGRRTLRWRFTSSQAVPICEDVMTSWWEFPDVHSVNLSVGCCGFIVL